MSSEQSERIKLLAVLFGVKGIEHRKRRVYCPGWVGYMRWLKPLLSTPLGESAVAKTAKELLPRIVASE